MTGLPARCTLLLLALLLIAGLPGAAAAAGRACLTSEVAGEVVEVDLPGQRLRLRTGEGLERVVDLAEGAVVRREGSPCSLGALRPIAPGFFQEVRLRLDGHGRAVLVEGAYPGAEARVLSVGGGWIVLQPLDEQGAPGQVQVVPSAPEAEVFRSGRWESLEVLQPGQWVWVLFDLHGRAKKIALPG